jgi:2-hydroxychromene-2-carboxylate isomerase
MIDFYFDVVSPYSWLAWHELRGSTRVRPATIRPVPVLFAAILDARGSIGPAEIPAKRAYVIRDVMRSAALAKLPFRFPPAHPFNPLKALRLCCAIADDERRLKLRGALLDAAWSAGEDLTDDQTIASALVRCGHAAEELASASSDAARAGLRSNTDEALARGVFGVPTFTVGPELFWGHDRLPHLEAWLAGALALDEGAYQGALVRPRGSDRKRAAPKPRDA